MSPNLVFSKRYRAEWGTWGAGWPRLRPRSETDVRMASQTSPCLLGPVHAAAASGERADRFIAARRVPIQIRSGELGRMSWTVWAGLDVERFTWRFPFLEAASGIFSNVGCCSAASRASSGRT